jgi:hypothetical protein
MRSHYTGGFFMHRHRHKAMTLPGVKSITVLPIADRTGPPETPRISPQPVSASTLTANFHLERRIWIKMVEEVLILGDRTIFLLDLVEHRFGCVETQHEIRDHASLNKSNPTMQLHRRPVLCVLNDLFTHPSEMIGTERLRQDELSARRLVLKDFQASVRHRTNQKIGLFHDVARCSEGVTAP